jgi:hypothetical protein
VISFRARRRQVVRQERHDQMRREIREQIALVARADDDDPEAIRQCEADLAFADVDGRIYDYSGVEVEPTLNLWRVAQPRPRARWLLSADPTNGCPCLSCVEVRANPMEERTPRRVPLSDADREQLGIHEAHLARDMALWYALDWKPRAEAEAARRRPDDRPADSAWARLRLVLEALGVLSPLSPEHDPLCLADRWLEVCPSHGPPAWGRSGSLVGLAHVVMTGGP